MEKVPGLNAHPKPHPPQQDWQQVSLQSLPPQAASTHAGVIVWSSCADKARLWEHRISRLDSYPVKVVADPDVLGRMVEESRPPAQPLVLLTFEQPLPRVLAARPDVLPAAMWPLLRSLPVAAVVPSLTREEQDDAVPVASTGAEVDEEQSGGRPVGGRPT